MICAKIEHTTYFLKLQNYNNFQHIYKKIIFSLARDAMQSEFPNFLP